MQYSMYEQNTEWVNILKVLIKKISPRVLKSKVNIRELFYKLLILVMVNNALFIMHMTF